MKNSALTSTKPQSLANGRSVSSLETCSIAPSAALPKHSWSARFLRAKSRGKSFPTCASSLQPIKTHTRRVGDENIGALHLVVPGRNHRLGLAPFAVARSHCRRALGHRNDRHPFPARKIH